MLAQTFDVVDELVRGLESSFADLVGPNGTRRSEWRMLPPTEVLRSDSEILVRVELPGVDPESIDVTMTDDILRIRADRRAPTAEQGEYLRRGFAYGTFEGTVALPARIDSGKLTARYEAGILEIRAPHGAAPAVKVPVQAGSAEQKALPANG
jgi:HSP20 family protein